MKISLQQIFDVIGKGYTLNTFFVDPCPVCGKETSCRITKNAGMKSLFRCENTHCTLKMFDRSVTDLLFKMKMAGKLTDEKQKDTLAKLMALSKTKKAQQYTGKGIRNFIYVETDEGYSFLTQQGYSQEMIESVQFFYTFETYERIKILFQKRNDKHIKNTPELRLAIIDEGWKWNFLQKHIVSFSKEEYMALVKDRAETYNRMSTLPEIQSDNLTRYTHKPIEPKYNGSFRRLLGLLTVRRGEEQLKNEYRLAAGFLSGFLGREYDGKRPMFVIQAESSSEGKSTAVQAGVRLIQGEIPIELGVDKADNKETIASVRQFANKYCVFDNVEYLTYPQMSLIRHYITDPTIPSWVMFTSRGRISNNKTYFMTVNGWVLTSTDLSETAIIIWMEKGENVSNEMRRNIDETLKSMSHDNLIEDILFHLEKVDWKTDVKHISHPKQTAWSRDMSKILHQFYPEVKAFDFHLSDEDREGDIYVQWINELIEMIYEKVPKDAEGKVCVSNKGVYEEWNKHHPEDHLFKSQKVLTLKISSIKNYIKGYTVISTKRVATTIPDDITGTMFSSKSLKQQRCWLISPKVQLRVVYTDNDLKKVLMAEGVSEARADIFVKVLKSFVLTQDNWVERVKPRVVLAIPKCSADQMRKVLGVFSVVEQGET